MNRLLFGVLVLFIGSIARAGSTLPLKQLTIAQSYEACVQATDLASDLISREEYQAAIKKLSADEKNTLVDLRLAQLIRNRIQQLILLSNEANTSLSAEQSASLSRGRSQLVRQFTAGAAELQQGLASGLEAALNAITPPWLLTADTEIRSLIDSVNQDFKSLHYYNYEMYQAYRKLDLSNKTAQITASQNACGIYADIPLEEEYYRINF